MEPNSSPDRTEDAGSSPQSYTSLRLAPVERPVTPPASLAKEKDRAPDDTKDEEARESIPDEATKSPVNNPRVSPPAKSPTSQPGPRPRRPLPNSPIRQRRPLPNSLIRQQRPLSYSLITQRSFRPWEPILNSPIRRHGASVSRGNDSSSKELENPPVRRRVIKGLAIPSNPVSQAHMSATQTAGHLNGQTLTPEIRQPTLFLAFPDNPIPGPDGQKPDYTPRYFPFHTLDVPAPPERPGGPEGTLRLLIRTSPHEPDYVPDWRANVFWKENVERVLGPEFGDKWPNMMALIREAKASFATKGDPLIHRRWNLTEIEIAARLKGWRMPDFVVGYLIGQPLSDFVMGNEEQFALWGYDEMKRMDEVDGMEGSGNSEEEEEVASGSDKVGEEKEKETDEKNEKDEEKGTEVEESDDDLQVYTRSMNR